MINSSDRGKVWSHYLLSRQFQVLSHYLLSRQSFKSLSAQSVEGAEFQVTIYSIDRGMKSWSTPLTKAKWLRHYLLSRQEKSLNFLFSRLGLYGVCSEGATSLPSSTLPTRRNGEKSFLTTNNIIHSLSTNSTRCVFAYPALRIPHNILMMQSCIEYRQRRWARHLLKHTASVSLKQWLFSLVVQLGTGMVVWLTRGTANPQVLHTTLITATAKKQVKVSVATTLCQALVCTRPDSATDYLVSSRHSFTVLV